MKFRVGQRVRSLHESGEGVITQLIDRHHVEVDWGDDFPIDVHVDDLIPIDRTEQVYLGSGTQEPESRAVSEKKIQLLDASLFEFSLFISRKDDENFDLYLVNPEPISILFAFYSRKKQQYSGLGAGRLFTGQQILVASFEEKELEKTKAFLIQALSFREGKGHPHVPLSFELSWNRSRIQQPARFLEGLGKRGWVFSLREDQQAKSMSNIPESEFVRIRKTDLNIGRAEVELDLHIEVLVAKAEKLNPAEILNIQKRKLEEALSKAVVDNYASLTIIHGVGEGRLKQIVIDAVKKTKHVKAFGPADPIRYGKGATKITFQ